MCKTSYVSEFFVRLYSIEAFSKVQGHFKINVNFLGVKLM